MKDSASFCSCIVELATGLVKVSMLPIHSSMHATEIDE